MLNSRLTWMIAAVALVALAAAWNPAMAEEPGTPASTEAAAAAEAAAPADPTLGFNKDLATTTVALDTVWVMIAGFLVMWMQAGFALVETGLTRAKNAVNICMKNLLDYSFGTLAFWAVGFGLMFSTGNDFIGDSGFFLNEEMVTVTADDGTTSEESNFAPLSWTAVPLESKFFFQLVFAATAATIVSGAMAERTKFASYMAYSLISA